MTTHQPGEQERVEQARKDAFEKWVWLDEKRSPPSRERSAWMHGWFAAVDALARDEAAVRADERARIKAEA